MGIREEDIFNIIFVKDENNVIEYITYSDSNSSNGERIIKKVYEKDIPDSVRSEIEQLMFIDSEKVIGVNAGEAEADEIEFLYQSQAFNDNTEYLCVVKEDGEEDIAYVVTKDGELVKTYYNDTMDRYTFENQENAEKLSDIVNAEELASAVEKVYKKVSKKLKKGKVEITAEEIAQQFKDSIEEITLERNDVESQEVVDDIEAIIIVKNDGQEPFVYIKTKDGNIEKLPYDEELMKDFIEKNQGDKSKVFEIVNDPEKEEQIEEIYQRNQQEEERAREKVKGRLGNVNKDTVKKVALAGGAVVLTAGTIAGVVALVNSCDKDNSSEIDYTTASFDSLMDSLLEDDERRVFFENVYSVTNTLNSKALDKDVFALEEDGDAVLHFTFEEVAAAKLVLNNYSAEELYEIYGEEGFDIDKVMLSYQSFASKMQLYSMNGKAPSSVATLIEDEDNREFFTTIENLIVEFNNSPSRENADNLIKTVGDYYLSNLGGVTNLNLDKASISGVKNLLINMVYGYTNANAEEDYQGYLVYSQNSSDTAEFVQQGDNILDYLDKAGTNCPIQAIRKMLEEERYELNNYDGEEEVDSRKPSVSDIEDSANKDIDPNGEIKSSELFNNRIRGLVREKAEGYTVTSDVWNKMTDAEKLDFAKKGGTVIYTKTEFKTDEVNKSDLTADEKDQASKGEEEINNDLAVQNAYAKGKQDANRYANETGAYSHSDIYITYDGYSQKAEFNGTLVNYVAFAQAFNNEEITSNDSQIRERRNNDTENFKNGGASSDAVNAYTKGWEEQIKAELESARERGKELKAQSDKAYEQAKEEAEKNNNNNNNNNNNKPSDDTPIYDENEDPNLKGPEHVDEDTVVGNEIPDYSNIIGGWADSNTYYSAIEESNITEYTNAPKVMVLR